MLICPLRPGDFDLLLARGLSELLAPGSSRFKAEGRLRGFTGRVAGMIDVMTGLILAFLGRPLKPSGRH